MPIKKLFILLLFSRLLSADNLYKVTLITSVYNGDLYIEEFLKDIVKQTIFPQCELIMINAHSPGNEEPVIKRYMEQYPNIVYIRLENDPGLFAVWNLGIKNARAPYVTNANLDDRFKYDLYETHVKYLDEHPEIDLVYSGCYITEKPNETFDVNSSNGKIVWHSQQEFDKVKQLFGLNPLLFKAIPYTNNHPIWRKSIHKLYGLFDERYRATGGLEFWIRSTICGNAKFKMLQGIYSLYYKNPEGISTKPDSLDKKEREGILKMYRKMYENIFKHIAFLA